MAPAPRAPTTSRRRAQVVAAPRPRAALTPGLGGASRPLGSCRPRVWSAALSAWAPAVGGSMPVCPRLGAQDAARPRDAPAWLPARGYAVEGQSARGALGPGAGRGGSRGNQGRGNGRGGVRGGACPPPKAPSTQPSRNLIFVATGDADPKAKRLAGSGTPECYPHPITMDMLSFKTC